MLGSSSILVFGRSVDFFSSCRRPWGQCCRYFAMLAGVATTRDGRLVSRYHAVAATAEWRKKRADSHVTQFQEDDSFNCTLRNRLLHSVVCTRTMRRRTTIICNISHEFCFPSIYRTLSPRFTRFVARACYTVDCVIYVVWISISIALSKNLCVVSTRTHIT